VLRVSDDIVSSPTLSLDVAMRIKSFLADGTGFGLYHLANEGAASLYELMREMVCQLGLQVTVERASYRDFPFVGRKNVHTPLSSVKTTPLRPWRDA